ncbi:hypothetical protein SABIM44S_00315 [Streptomyces abikoensis]
MLAFSVTTDPSCALARLGDLIGDLAGDLEFALSPEFVLDRDLDLARDLDLNRVRNLVGTLARVSLFDTGIDLLQRNTGELITTLSRDLGLAVARVRLLILGLPEPLDHDVASALDLDPHVLDPEDLLIAERRFSSTAARLRVAGNDFCHTDLHSIVLDNVPLEGVRWNDKTNWPTAWRSRILRASTRNRDGIYIIRAQPHGTCVPVDA